MSKSNIFYGQFKPQQDKYLYDNFFKDIYDGVSIEAGASNGLLENNTKFFEDTLNWKTISIEPLPDWYEELVINRPNNLNINKCLHPFSSGNIVDFYIPKLELHGYKNHLGSLNLSTVDKYNTTNKKISVETITYNDVIDKFNIDKLNLFTLDIEGYEIDFLQSFNKWKVYPEVFVVEVGHISAEKLNKIILEKYSLYGKHFVNNIYTLN